MRASILVAFKSQIPAVVRSAARSDGISRWIASPQYNLSTVQGDVFLNPFAPDAAAESIASDCLRLSFAGRETLQSVRDIRLANATHAAWSAIQLYYSAFYYTSSLLRIIGVSNSFLYTDELRSLRSLANALSIPQIPSSGLFNLELSTTANQIKLSPVTGSGSHEALWKEFRRQIGIMKASVTSIPEFTSKDVLEALSDLDELETASKGIGSSINLSTVRNDIQYRQRLSCWHPNLRDVKRFHRTDRIGQVFSRDFNPANIIQTGRDYDDFFTKCLLISAFCHNVLLYLSESSNRGSLADKYLRYHNSTA